MQSSTAVVGRALIMLACVVGIPVVALSGTSWADMVKKLQDYHWPVVLGLASASATDSAAIDGISPPDVRMTMDTSSRADLASQNSLSESPRQLGIQPESTSTVAMQPPRQDTPSSVVPVSYQSSTEMTPVAAAVATVDDTKGVAAAAFTSDPFRSIQSRLRQLGATYYLLESWGNDQQMYRFYCKMAVGGSEDYTRCFEAMNADPLQAMTQVLQQVEGQRRGVEHDPKVNN